MKKLIIVTVILAASVMLMAMASNPKTGCHKNQSCYNVWQCYGASISDCQKEAQEQVNPKEDPKGYWDLVGGCQARFCNS